MPGAAIEDRMHGIEPEPVYMKLIEPHQRVLDKIITHAIAPGAIKIYGIAPVQFVLVCKVRPVIT
jgi:hypothetical protein